MRLSQQAKRKIVHLYQRGMAIKVIAKLFGVSPDAIKYHVYPKRREALIIRTRRKRLENG